MKNSSTVKAAVIAMVLTLCIAIFAFWLLGQSQVWEMWRPATCVNVENNCFCERIHNVGIKQPINTASAFAFVLVGLFVLLSDRMEPGTRDQNEQVFNKRVFSSIYAVVLVIVGLGTALYHASLTFIGQTLDIAGMYLVVILLGVYSLAQPRRWSIAESCIVYILGSGVLLWTATIFPASRRYIFAAIVATIPLIEISYRRYRSRRIKYRYLVLAFASIIIGHLFWRLDYYRVLCNPDSLLQGHAIWHLLGALAAFFAHRFYMLR